MIKEAHLVLADGTRFTGQSFGAEGAATGEAVFTTGMTGYEEVLTDPSYCGQIVTMTAPQIGNTGVNIEDSEARRPALRGFVVRELSAVESNWRTKESLNAYLERCGIVGITGVDTRTLTRHIRDVGAQMGAVGTEDPATLHDRAKAAPPMTGQNLTGEVTTPEVYQWTEGSGVWSEPRERARPWHVVAMDFGVKLNILRCLVDEGCKVTVVPATAKAEQILALDPDGIFLSNGPGDPAAVSGGIETVRELLGQRPIFGICLGHQLMSLALGGQSYKLKFGHRGLNQPVKDLKTGRIEITTQNHGFCVDVDSLTDKCELTHLHLNDQTCEGIEHVETGAFSVQYHPEAAAGPHDSRYLFRRFTDAIARARS
ncbi:MAG: glutamine-hydrolyzing carbamoyl-phosphate synthase small subunit [Myxococcales bacterium]|jgi:carbamoyl-phosphate synthase small subunit|nr:glutamine-hydrolyzing carbamoyl-phosphate synthase small subunit [Myxococcales bacterium]